LTEDGLQKRKNELIELYKLYQKQSHADAIKSVDKFINSAIENPNKLSTKVFEADLLKPEVLNAKGFKADIIISDVPYGKMASWVNRDGNEMNIFLNNLLPVIDAQTVIAIISDKAQKIKNTRYERLEKFQIGKRKIELMRCVY
jgi:hypothetical protein